MSSNENKPRAFVIMPFDSEARPIFDDFIKSTLTDVGFEVFRADDLLNQQNILGDILSSIATADLIIADLTDSNPNVYYELGLAHALGRPVILLGQDMEEIPFDIRSYRLIVYNTHFSQIADAKQRLRASAEGFLSGQLVVRNPVADFLGGEVERRIPTSRAAGLGTRPETSPDDRGFIDHVEDLEGSYKALTSVMEELNDQTRRIGERTERAAARLRQAGAQGGTAGRNRVRKVARAFSQNLREFQEFLSEANARYETAARTTENSLEFVLEFVGLAAQDDPGGTKGILKEQLEVLGTVLASAKGAREAFLSLWTSMNGVPPLERQLTRALASAAQEVRQVADNIGQTEAAISRGIEVGERIRSGIDDSV